MKKEVVILANGSFPQNPQNLRLLKSAKYIVCCDGAINKLEEFGVEPYAIVGDLDSIAKDIKKKYAHILYHIAEQDTNDLTKTMNWCLENGFKKAVILGATGQREDHSIANIFLLLRYAKVMDVCMMTDYGEFRPLLENTCLESFEGQQVSIFSPSETTRVTTVGLKYPINNAPLPELWSGTLNESKGDHFEVNFKGRGLVVYLVYS